MSLSMNYGTGVISLPARALEANAGLMDLRVLALLCARSDLAASYPDGIEELAQLAGCDAGAVRESVAFWHGAGILSSESGAPMPKTSRTIKVDRALIRDTVPEYSGEELARMTEESGDLKFLIDQCQSILGKMLSRTEIEKIAALNDYLRLEKEYILLLVQYCVRQGKKSIAYITKTAYNLFNEGIDDYPKLDAHIRRKERYYSVVGRLRSMMGIGERELTKKENTFIHAWIEDYTYPFEILQMAYQITVDSIGEVSFDYMGKILSTWFEMGVKTVEDAERAVEKRKNERAQNQNTPQGTGGDFSSFNTDAFFEAALKRSARELEPAGAGSDGGKE